jgi:UDP-N-acetylmuramoylalanine--D-glutamate ligase
MKLILGNGKTAQSIAHFLDRKDILFTLLEDTREIKDKDILQGIDEIFISPGIPQTQDIVIWARAQNIPITSDIELFSRFAKAPIIGITGSNGKSTVTQLLGEMIANDGKKHYLA